MVDLGLPSQSTAGASTSAGPVLSTPAAPTPNRVRLEDGGDSQHQEEEAALAVKDSSAPQSSAQGTTANAPRGDEAAVKDSSNQAEGNTSTHPTPAQKDNVVAEKENSLDDF